MNTSPVPPQPGQPAQYAQPAPYGQPVQYAQPPRTDGLAIASFVCALCGLGLIPVILGHLSLSRIKREGLGGTAFAVIGLVLGYLALAATVVAVIVIGATILWSTTSR